MRHQRLRISHLFRHVLTFCHPQSLQLRGLLWDLVNGLHRKQDQASATSWQLYCICINHWNFYRCNCHQKSVIVQENWHTNGNLCFLELPQEFSSIWKDLLYCSQDWDYIRRMNGKLTGHFQSYEHLQIHKVFHQSNLLSDCIFSTEKQFDNSVFVNLKLNQQIALYPSSSFLR